MTALPVGLKRFINLERYGQLQHRSLLILWHRLICSYNNIAALPEWIGILSRLTEYARPHGCE